MKRAKATALALANWKGVFFERYLLDQHVTALEGANGAGKTTVMIAAYLVLLPDLSRLRFTNVGETGATGGDRGIWGRLGEPGRPSFAALQVEVPTGERLVAGVVLERRQEPSLVVSPFLVSGLGAGVRLSDLLLLSSAPSLDEIPTLADFRDNTQRVGAKLQVFATIKEYFGALFEHGISPLRLASDEDRTKFNEMLRTSMTGGISRALTTELRSFVLKQETGLSDALGRMRGNLAACRRTRTEVAEARQLEQELRGVYDAALAMTAAALAATEQAGVESDRLVQTAHQELERTVSRHRALEASAAEARTRQQTIAARVASAQAQVARSAQVKECIVRARSAAQRLAECQREIGGIQARAQQQRLAQARCQAARTAAKRDQEQAREALARTAEGLANLQTGLDELHRQAHAHRLVQKSLAEARELLGNPSLDEHSLAAVLAEVRARREAIDAERARRDREAEYAVCRQGEYARALGALEQLQELPPSPPGELVHALDPGSPYDVARAALARLNDYEALSHRAADLDRERREHSALAQRQTELTEQALALGVDATGEAASSVIAALSEAEGCVSRLEETEREERGRAQDLRRELERGGEALDRLQRAAERWVVLGAAAEQLESSSGPPPKSHEALTARLAELQRKLEHLRTAHRRLSEQIEAAAPELRRLETGMGDVHPDLVLAADVVGGELLAARFEDLEPHESRVLEARLGPMRDGLVVDDPLRAALKLRGTCLSLDSVWLIASDAELPVPVAGDEVITGQVDDADVPSEVIVPTPEGARLTRVAAESSLGRRGRARRLADLAARLADWEGEHAAQRREIQELDAAIRAGQLLVDGSSAWLAGDPAPELAALKQRLGVATAAAREHEQRAHEAREAMATARARVVALRTLVPEALAVSGVDHSTRARDLDEDLARALSAQAILESVAGPRETLRRLIDCLRQPPPDADALSSWTMERAVLEAERDRCFRLAEALAAVEANRQAFLWGDAARVLGERTELVPELKAQHERARELLAAAETLLEGVEREWEEATTRCQEVEAELLAVQAHAERARTELLAEGAEDTSDEALVRINVRLARHEETLSGLQAEERGLAAELAVAEEREKQARATVTECQMRLIQEEQRALPAREAWARLQELVVEKGGKRLGALLGARAPESPVRVGLTEALLPSPTDAAFWAEARSRRELLLDRLEGARGGQELLTLCRERIAQQAEADATGYFELWLLVEDLVKRRLPAPFADLGDPLTALERLRDDLAHLEKRLARQELDLGGAAEDVARGIEVQIRRAAGQVRRLNEHLAGISFGGISAIRTRIERVERMEQVLQALRDGAVQELLFQPTLAIEEALEEIFQRYGAGRSGAQRLLDYREYVELFVEIQRRTGTDWELANPTRLSTGEAIGVGAALMMVILTEWERDSNLLRAKPKRNSLRFLFLDEANRLSQDNLRVLFDLCKGLDLQLLIAAPEVAHAEGNTTYRLVRRLVDSGHEEVIVSGRRTSHPDREGIEAGESRGPDQGLSLAVEDAAAGSGEIGEAMLEERHEVGSPSAQGELF